MQTGTAHPPDPPVRRAEAPALRVRPYLLTGGRTQGSVELPLETQLVTCPEGSREPSGLGPEYLAILRCCAQPQSVAEVSAHCGLHIQVARILLGDLLEARLVTARTAATTSSHRSDLQLLERVLDGLQSL